MLEFRTASTLDDEALTALWNAGYEGYFAPVHFTPDHFRRHVHCGGIDLDRSLLLAVDGRPAGFSLLGVDGERGWIGGFGIAPEFRGRGLSYPLIREHAGRFAGWGMRHVQLEVFVQNWARKTYEAAGFRATRRLPLLTGAAPAGGDPLRRVPVERALAHHARLHADWPASWNRQPRFVRRALPDDAAAVVVGPEERPTAFAIAAPAGERVRLFGAAAADEEAAARLVGWLGAEYPGRTVVDVNEPEGSPVHRALLAAGWTEESAQFEMHRSGG